jgi:hypothetical protein
MASSGRRTLRRTPASRPQINKLAYMAVAVVLRRCAGIPSFAEARKLNGRKSPRSAAAAELHADPTPIVSCVVLILLTGSNAIL